MKQWYALHAFLYSNDLSIVSKPFDIDRGLFAVIHVPENCISPEQGSGKQYRPHRPLV